MSLPTVDAWVRAGMPYRQRGGRGREWRFYAAEVVEWLAERARSEGAREAAPLEDLEDSRARKVRLEAELLELELEEKRRTLVPVEESAREVEAAFELVRARLLALPARVAPRLEGLEDRVEVRRVLNAAVREILGELASDGAGDGDAGAGGGDGLAGDESASA